jgi:SAM-dependent methyltransferase
VAGKDVCDVGVGQGLLLAKLRDGGARSLTGVDVSPTYLRRIPADRPVRRVLASAERLPFAGEFDTLVATDVLEHVLNVGDCLLSAHRALRPGGRLVVRVPYRDDLIAYARLSGYRYPFIHLRSFDSRELRRLLRGAGFRIESQRYSGFYLDKLRPLLRRNEHVDFRLRTWLANRFGGTTGVTRIDPRLGRLLMRPNVLTATASKPASEGSPA